MATKSVIFISQPKLICLISTKDSDKSPPPLISNRLYELQEDPVQQRILESAKTFGNQHDMNQADSIRQAIKLRKYLFINMWPDQNIEENEEASEDQEDSTAPTSS